MNTTVDELMDYGQLSFWNSSAYRVTQSRKAIFVVIANRSTVRILENLYFFAPHREDGPCLKIDRSKVIVLEHIQAPCRTEVVSTRIDTMKDRVILQNSMFVNTYIRTVRMKGLVLRPGGNHTFKGVFITNCHQYCISIWDSEVVFDVFVIEECDQPCIIIDEKSNIKFKELQINGTKVESPKNNPYITVGSFATDVLNNRKVIYVDFTYCFLEVHTEQALSCDLGEFDDNVSSIERLKLLPEMFVKCIKFLFRMNKNEKL